MASKLPVYLDYASTTPVDERVLKIMMPYFHQHFGNAASKSHAFGWIANEAVQNAREQIAALIKCSTEEIVFTSGATESVNLALRGITENSKQKKHIISFATEHRAVLDTLQALEKQGFLISILPVSEDGQIDLEKIEHHIRPDTLMIVCMYANNETGIIYPVKEIGKIAEKHQLFFFCDATQAVGKIKIDVNDDIIHMMAFTAHKMYGPKGVGALYVRRKNPRIELMPQITGGEQENNRRSGTLNVPGIVGFGEAAALCLRYMEEEEKFIRQLKKQIEDHALNHLGAHIHGHNQHRLPHISNIFFPSYKGKSLIPDLCMSLALSAGSACNSGHTQGSHVLKAMGLSPDEISKSLRISIGRFTTQEDISIVTNSLNKIIG
jgi:cysteine desulfurase